VQQVDIDRAWSELVIYAQTLMGITGDRQPVVPGLAIGVVWLPRERPWVQGFGVRKLGGSQPIEGMNQIDGSTVFPLASLSKPISSTVMTMAMNENAELSWSDQVPGLGSYRELFAHRTGLPDHAGDLLEDLGYLRTAILQQLVLLARNPVGAYAYTNFGLTAAAEHAAERIGKPWEQLAAQLYAKLGMRDTSSLFGEFERNGPRRTWGHVWRDGGWQHEVQRNPDQQSPAGGVTSTVDDLVKWMRLQLGGQLEGLDVTHTPFEGDNGYALGWNAKTRWKTEIVDGVETKQREVLELGHSGAFDLGAGTSVTLWPPDQLGIIALTNAAPIGVAESLCAAFGRLVRDPKQTAARLLNERMPSRVQPEHELPLFENIQEFMKGSLNLPRRSNAVPAPGKPVVHDDSPFQGTYTDEFYGEVELCVKDGRLVMHMGPEKRERFDLSPTDEPNVFVFDSGGEFGAINNRVEFKQGAGTDDSVGIWNLLLTYPQALARDSDTRCPLSGVIRLWSVEAKRAARLALTVSRDGVAGSRTSPPVDVHAGLNWSADAGLEVLAGDMVGFSIDDQVYSQVATDDFDVSFSIDRQGTFARVRGRDPA
jgi:CubicO group peptidase (beta-lactamase class C family)